MKRKMQDESNIYDDMYVYAHTNTQTCTLWQHSGDWIKFHMTATGDVRSLHNDFLFYSSICVTFNSLRLSCSSPSSPSSSFRDPMIVYRRDACMKRWGTDNSTCCREWMLCSATQSHSMWSVDKVDEMQLQSNWIDDINQLTEFNLNM